MRIWILIINNYKDTECENATERNTVLHVHINTDKFCADSEVRKENSIQGIFKLMR